MDLVRFLLGGFDDDVGEARRAFAARCAREGNGGHAECLCHAEGVEDVLRVARGGDAEEDVARAPEPEHLLGKGEVGCLIVRERRADRELGWEGDGGECALKVAHEVVDGHGVSGVARLVEFCEDVLVEVTRQEKALHQFTDDVLGICRRAAVAADNELAARVVGGAECLDGGADVRTAGLECGIACDERVNGGKGG